MVMKKRFKRILIASSLAATLIGCSKGDSSSNNTGTNDPQQIFKEFWNIYDRHYPLFHRKGINWQTVYETYYPKIKSTTTDQQLYQVLSTIQKEVIKDGHTDIRFKQLEYSFSPTVNQQVIHMVEHNTPKKVAIDPSSVSNPYISYGTLVSNTDIGYINSKNFEPSNDTESELNRFKAIVDKALDALKSKKGIIIDVRTNGGGQGPYAYYLAGRFFASARPIPLVRQRIKYQKGSALSSLGAWATQTFRGFPDPRVSGGYVAGVFTEDNTIQASGSYQYTQKVAVLTAKSTASAAEYFTAAMKTQGHVKTFGETTFGIFAGSDIFTLTHGNKNWKTRVSTHDIEIKYNGKFVSFEGVGIKPDMELIPTTNQINQGKDIHLTAAIQYLQ